MVASGGEVLSQLRRGAAQFCILALVLDDERYGLDLVKPLADAGLVASEGTVYPILSRLQSAGYVAPTWRESPSGPPRKYYAITAAGKEALDQFIVDWRRFRDTVDQFLSREASP